MPAADVWVGLDLGTQSVRALAVGVDGIVAGSGSRKLTGRRDGPRHEQDPGDWWHAVAAVSRDALRDVDRDAVRGVAVDATSGTVLLTDRDGSPLTPRPHVRRHPRRCRGRPGQRGRRGGLARARLPADAAGLGAAEAAVAAPRAPRPGPPGPVGAPERPRH